MSFNIIYSSLRLNKDICNIIFKYINLTPAILYKLAFKCKDKANEYFNDQNNKLTEKILKNLEKTTLIDIISLIIPLGWTGFVLSIKNDKYKEIINKDPNILNGLLYMNYCYKSQTITITINKSDPSVRYVTYSKIGYLYSIISLYNITI